MEETYAIGCFSYLGCIDWKHLLPTSPHSAGGHIAFLLDTNTSHSLIEKIYNVSNPNQALQTNLILDIFAFDRRDIVSLLYMACNSLVDRLRCQDQFEFEALDSHSLLPPTHTHTHTRSHALGSPGRKRSRSCGA